MFTPTPVESRQIFVQTRWFKTLSPLWTNPVYNARKFVTYDRFYCRASPGHTEICVLDYPHIVTTCWWLTNQIVLFKFHLNHCTQHSCRVQLDNRRRDNDRYCRSVVNAIPNRFIRFLGWFVVFVTVSEYIKIRNHWDKKILSLFTYNCTTQQHVCIYI